MRVCRYFAKLCHNFAKKNYNLCLDEQDKIPENLMGLFCAAGSPGERRGEKSRQYFYAMVDSTGHHAISRFARGALKRQLVFKSNRERSRCRIAGMAVLRKRGVVKTHYWLPFSSRRSVSFFSPLRVPVGDEGCDRNGLRGCGFASAEDEVEELLVEQEEEVEEEVDEKLVLMARDSAQAGRFAFPSRQDLGAERRRKRGDERGLCG